MIVLITKSSYKPDGNWDFKMHSLVYSGLKRQWKETFTTLTTV